MNLYCVKDAVARLKRGVDLEEKKGSGVYKRGAPKYEERIKAVRDLHDSDPSLSTREISKCSGIPRTAVQRIRKRVLKKRQALRK